MLYEEMKIMQFYGTLKIATKEDFDNMNSLLLDGKRYRIEKEYKKIVCWGCSPLFADLSNPICKYCIEKEKREELNWINNLSDKEIEKLYDQIKR